jgi:deoxycytidylate deaminase
MCHNDEWKAHDVIINTGAAGVPFFIDWQKNASPRSDKESERHSTLALRRCVLHAAEKPLCKYLANGARIKQSVTRYSSGKVAIELL